MSLHKRIQNQLNNNWYVEAQDIQELINMIDGHKGHLLEYTLFTKDETGTMECSRHKIYYSENQSKLLNGKLTMMKESNESKDFDVYNDIALYEILVKQKLEWKNLIQ